MKQLDNETGKLYKAFGVERERALLIYNAVAENVLTDECRMKVTHYLNPALAICENENERMYCCYQFADMFSGFDGRRKTAAQIETFRLEFSQYEPDKQSMDEYNDDHHQQN